MSKYVLFRLTVTYLKTIITFIAPLKTLICIFITLPIRTKRKGILILQTNANFIDRIKIKSRCKISIDVIRTKYFHFEIVSYFLVVILHSNTLLYFLGANSNFGEQLPPPFRSSLYNVEVRIKIFSC